MRPEDHADVPLSATPFDRQLAGPVLLPFCDDSTLFFALRMRECLHQADPDQPVHMGLFADENALSDRQMEQLLPTGPDMVIRGASGFHELFHGGSYKAVVTSRMYAPLDEELRAALVRGAAGASGRPCVLGFLGGLDFFPQTGYHRRRLCDVVYLFPKGEMATYAKWSKGWEENRPQEIGFGHPTFLMPHELPPDALATRKDIYFFAQALSPSTRRGRLHMLQAMAAIARANPDRTIWIKLRHLPGENRKHLHLERYDYPGLLKSLPNVPENLRFTACTMDEALEGAALGITCTSTAAIDVLRAGVPCMVHLDFVDNYVDPLVGPMRRLFDDSGVITSLDDMLHLRAPQPNAEWVGSMFCPRDLGARVLQAVQAFQSVEGDARVAPVPIDRGVT